MDESDINTSLGRMGPQRLLTSLSSLVLIQMNGNLVRLAGVMLMANGHSWGRNLSKKYWRGKCVENLTGILNFLSPDPICFCR